MLSRRGFFRAAAGAAAVAAGGASAAAAPAAVNVGVDIAAAGADRAVIWTRGMDIANHEMVQAVADAAGIPVRFLTGEMPDSDWANDRGKFGSVGYSFMTPNDATKQQFAANLPVIGADPLPKNTPAQRARQQRLLKECNKPVPEKETEKQFLKRLSLPCPGRLE